MDELSSLIEQVVEQSAVVYRAMNKIAPDIADLCATMREELLKRGFDRVEALQIMQAILGQMGKGR